MQFTRLGKIEKEGDKIQNTDQDQTTKAYRQLRFKNYIIDTQAKSILKLNQDHFERSGPRPE